VELMGVSLRAECNKIRESGFRLEAIMSCMNAAQSTLLERFHDVDDTRWAIATASLVQRATTLAPTMFLAKVWLGGDVFGV
jgi:hypothetical protein